MDQQGNSGSARSARKRIQVGATNRSFASSNAASPLSAAAEKGSGVSGGRSNAQNGNTSHHLREGRATSVGNLQRPGSAATNSATIQKRHAASHQVSALALSDRSADKASHSVREPLSTSRSMPALRMRPQMSRNEACSIGANGATPENLTARNESGVTDGSGRPPADDFYMSSTQMSYMSGLQTPESKVPSLDPYRYRALLHERWIKRASQRLADLANMKFGSIKDFFRLYDSNFDGVLDFDEFSKGITMCQLDHLFPRSLQRSLFDKIDSDKSGTIELNEFAAFLDGGLHQRTPATAACVRQKQAQERLSQEFEARSVHLQPINDYKTQRIKTKLCYCLNKAVPNASTGLADNRTMFLKKQFGILQGGTCATNEGISSADLAMALGPRGINIGVSEDDVKCLIDAMDTNGDGKVTLNEFSSFLNLDDHEPLYQPLFDGRRRTVNILQGMVDASPATATEEEAFVVCRADQLHSAAVPSRAIDEAVRARRISQASSANGNNSPNSRVIGRPNSPAWTTSQDPTTVTTASGRRTVFDVWDLPAPTRHLSAEKRLLTSAMRCLPRTVGKKQDSASVAFGSAGGPAAEMWTEMASCSSHQKKALSSVSSSSELFSSLDEDRMQAAAAKALARSRKVAKSTWADVGHGGIGAEAGTDENSSFYACPEERFKTTNSERFGALLKEKKIEKGQRSAGFWRQRPGDSATSASQRFKQSEDRTMRLREHQERVALIVRAEEVAARLKEERRVRGKARTRLRYLKWVNGQDNWLQDEVPKLADFDKRQFPDQNIRLRGGQQMHEALGGPMAMAV